ncbi:hypothetical protein C9E91_08400 [Rhizobium sp. SEMIA4064]|nr:hypothetical protein C9E91_08400 [Rhizobium sp. SEMIA4064]
MTFRIHDWPEFVEAPPQRSTRVVWNFPEHLAKMLAALRSSDNGQIGKKSAGFLRLRQRQKLSLPRDIEFAQYLDGELANHDALTRRSVQPRA